MNSGDNSTPDHLAKWLAPPAAARVHIGTRAHPRQSVVPSPALPDRDPGVCPPQRVYLEKAAKMNHNCVEDRHKLPVTQTAAIKRAERDGGVGGGKASVGGRAMD